MKDYKPRPKAKKGGSTLIGIFIGLVLGLALAAAIAVYIFKAPVPFVNKQRAPERAPPAPSAEAPKARQESRHEDKVAAADKPRFDFYKILPGKEEPVTEKQVRDAARETSKPGAPKESYVIQVGAFQNPAEADNLKAKLALMGLEAKIDPTQLADRGTWYRVRLGPYGKLDEINHVRQTLAGGGIDAQLVKLKEATRQN